MSIREIVVVDRDGIFAGKGLKGGTCFEKAVLRSGPRAVVWGVFQ
jgi:hypothetical protein